MLVAIVSFAAGALAALATLRALVRRSVISEITEELTDRRWQAIMGAAGYSGGGTDVAERAAARFEAELARGTGPRLGRGDRRDRREQAATLTPAAVAAVPATAHRTMLGLVFRVRP